MTAIYLDVTQFYSFFVYLVFLIFKIKTKISIRYASYKKLLFMQL